MTNLSQTIKNFIAENGGRIKLGHLIVSESPEWFSPMEIKHFKTRYTDNFKKMQKYIHTRNDFWTEEDIQFLLDNYGKMRTKSLCTILDRSAVAIRLKFADIATTEQRQLITHINNKWQRSSNFKFNAN